MTAPGYLQAAREYYRTAAETPQPGLCCTTSPVWKLPGLEVPEQMLEMNYGCGTTVHPRDLARARSVAYVGIGGGLELLQFAYFCRSPGAVIGVEPVEEMRAACAANLREAADRNAWFEASFVELRPGDALDLPVAAESVDLVAQNCLFNIFEPPELRRALAEAHRALRPRGRLVLCDPIAPFELPPALRRDERLRAMCLSGAQTLERYCDMVVEAGFGTLEVRARRPYRLLDPLRYPVAVPVLLETVELAAVREPPEEDGPCVFTGRSAVYFGLDEAFDDGRGHRLTRGVPVEVCDKTAHRLERLRRPDLLVTPSTFFHQGGGCC